MAGPLLVVTATDYHTAGEPFRIVTGGVPPIPGRTILEQRRWAQEHLERVRKLLVYEPRGHADMYGCFVTEPEDEGADFGVLFFHNAGYSTACGHGTIAFATAAVETGMVKAAEPETRLTLDVPSGRLPVRVAVEGGRATGAAFRNIPAWIEATGLQAAGVVADVAYGGAFYGSVEVSALGLGVDPESVPALIQLGRDVKRGLEAQRQFVHPESPDIRDIYGVTFWQDEGEDEGRIVQRNVTVFADGEVDRSPCGSGTSARLALLDTERTLLHRSVIGTEFEARIVKRVEAAGHPAVVTEIAGSAHRTGSHEFVLEPDDPLGEGFLLR
ncbi:MAG TPA: proline racemase family protein [Gaiellaceae bacterium]|nr:proline racemase family protein [Gaiellaceae bacterium]